MQTGSRKTPILPSDFFKLEEIQKLVTKAITRGVLRVETAIKLNLSGKVLHVQTGRLRTSIRHKVKQMRGGKRIVGMIGTNVVYAMIHEFGGTIVPKTGKFLTIPAEGVLGSARDYDNTYPVIQGDKGRIMQKQGNGKARVLFWLVRSVRIPERPYIRPAIRDTRLNVENDLRTILKGLRVRSIRN